MENKVQEVNISQIAFISNRKNLIAACDYLQAPDLHGDPDKCPASLHARYSRIKLILTDFEKEPSVVMSYNLEPSEIRLLYQKICMLNMTERSFEWSVTKDFSSFDSNRMQIINITRQSKRNDQKFNYPWTISIAVGTFIDKKFQPKKSAKKYLSDDEIQKFFGDIVSYISVWEMTFGAPFIRNVIEPYKAKRREEIIARAKAKKGQSGSSQYAPTAPDYDGFDDDPL
mgnify:CR=1 FL=1